MRERLAPIIAGVAGLGWFWMELAPQRAGFEDTDNPAVSLTFLAIHPEAWTQAGLLLGIAALALLATVLARRRDLAVADTGEPERSIVPTFVAVIGIGSAVFFLGLAIVRLGGEPLRYVAGLNQAWGEASYLVTQFVGIHLFGVGGALLLPLWIASMAYLGARRGIVPKPLAWLALVPLFRVMVVVAGWLGLSLDGLWPLYMAAIPAGWAWLILLGVAARPHASSVIATAQRTAPAGL